MTDNRRIWDAICTPPLEALKPIVGGRLAGKMDINPQWRMRTMTEQFGPVGVGWKYTIDKLWTEPGSAGQIVVFALVNVCWRLLDGEAWSDPIPGIGGNMLVEQEKNGLHTSDEAYKMAVTDALSVAFKALGMAADVYMGMMGDSKYSPSAPAAQPARSEAPRSGGNSSGGASQGSDVKAASEKQVKMLFALAHKLNIKETVEDAVHSVKEKNGDVIPMAWVSKQIDRMQAQAEKAAAQAAEGSDDNAPYDDDTPPY